jgi:dTDP-glucose 4,6-dehydratase
MAMEKNVRDWLYVLDHCKAIDLVFHQGKSAETYNVGGRNEKTNLEVVGTICSILDEVKPRQDGKKYDELISFVKDRSGHDRRYAIDASKLENELNWRADENFATGIRKTVQWYLDNSK